MITAKKYYNLILFIIIFNIAKISLAYNEDPELALTHDNRIRTYVYNKNEVYLLPLTFGFQSIVEFAKNEEVKTIVLGDTYSWKITPMDNKLSIKALEKNIRTNMMVTTNKRTYYFDLIAKANDDDLLAQDNMVYVVRFFYPK